MREWLEEVRLVVMIVALFAAPTIGIWAYGSPAGGELGHAAKKIGYVEISARIDRTTVLAAGH